MLRKQLNLLHRGMIQLRPAVPHGKIDTVLYSSKTVGTKRKATIYTPQVLKQKISRAVPVAWYWR